MGTVKIHREAPERHQHPAHASFSWELDPAEFDLDRFEVAAEKQLSDRWHTVATVTVSSILVTLHYVARGAFPADFAGPRQRLHLPVPENDTWTREQLCGHLGCGRESTADCPLTKADADTLVNAKLRELRA